MAILKCECGHDMRSHELLSVDGGKCFIQTCPCDYFSLDEDQFQPKLRSIRDYEGFIEEQEGEK